MERDLHTVALCSRHEEYEENLERGKGLMVCKMLSAKEGFFVLKIRLVIISQQCDDAAAVGSLNFNWECNSKCCVLCKKKKNANSNFCVFFIY